jgi:hypothetical protein
MPFSLETLTSGQPAAMIWIFVATATNGCENPDHTGVKAPFPGVFLCLPFRQAFSPALSVMAGCIGQPQGWPVPVSGILTPLHPVAPAVRSIGGGLSPSIQDKPL